MIASAWVFRVMLWIVSYTMSIVYECDFDGENWYVPCECVRRYRSS
jgi:hypothetical protein